MNSIQTKLAGDTVELSNGGVRGIYLNKAELVNVINTIKGMPWYPDTESFIVKSSDPEDDDIKIASPTISGIPQLIIERGEVGIMDDGSLARHALNNASMELGTIEEAKFYLNQEPESGTVQHDRLIMDLVGQPLDFDRMTDSLPKVIKSYVDDSPRAFIGFF